MNVPLGTQTVMSLEGAGGIQAEKTPYQYQFRLGPNSFSSYSADIVGRAYLRGGIEIRYDLGGGLTTIVLADAGEVWEANQPLEFRDLLVS